MNTVPLPAGVTVHASLDDVVPHSSPRNLLERAAMERDRDAAMRMIAQALEIELPSNLAEINLTWASRWARMEPWGRLAEIGNWLKAEAYECIDFVQGPAVDTRGD